MGQLIARPLCISVAHVFLARPCWAQGRNTICRRAVLVENAAHEQQLERWKPLRKLATVIARTCCLRNLAL